IWQEAALGADYDYVDIPSDMDDEVEMAREELLEACAEIDDDFMEKYLEGEDISEEEIHRVLRKGTLALDCVPVLSGTAFKNKGIQPLLNAVVYYLPAPTEVPAVEGITPKAFRRLTEERKEASEEDIRVRKADDKEPFSALAFK